MLVSIQFDHGAMKRDLGSLGKSAAFAQVVALTRTGLDVAEAEREEMRAVFDRPSPYTLRSVVLKPATRAKPEASVRLKDDSLTSGAGIAATKYVGPQIEGGTRSIKRFERRLQLDGQMPAGWFTVPGKFARLDAYGNLSRGQIAQILSQLTLTKTSGYSAGISVRSRKGAIRRAGQLIALPKGRGKLPPGIYQAMSFAQGRSTPRPVVIFVKSVSYPRRLDYFGVASRAAETFYAANLEQAMAQYASGPAAALPAQQAGQP